MFVGYLGVERTDGSERAVFPMLDEPPLVGSVRDLSDQKPSPRSVQTERGALCLIEGLTERIWMTLVAIAIEPSQFTASNRLSTSRSSLWPSWNGVAVKNNMRLKTPASGPPSDSASA